MKIEISAERGQTQRGDYWDLAKRLDEHVGAEIGFGLSVWPGAGDVCNLSGGKKRLAKALFFLRDEGVIDDESVIEGYEQLGLPCPAKEVLLDWTKQCAVLVVAPTFARAKELALDIVAEELEREDESRWNDMDPLDPKAVTAWSTDW